MDTQSRYLHIPRSQFLITPAPCAEVSSLPGKLIAFCAEYCVAFCVLDSRRLRCATRLGQSAVFPKFGITLSYADTPGKNALLPLLDPELFLPALLLTLASDEHAKNPNIRGKAARLVKHAPARNPLLSAPRARLVLSLWRSAETAPVLVK